MVKEIIIVLQVGMSWKQDPLSEVQGLFLGWCLKTEKDLIGFSSKKLVYTPICSL